MKPQIFCCGCPVGPCGNQDENKGMFARLFGRKQKYSVGQDSGLTVKYSKVGEVPDVKPKDPPAKVKADPKVKPKKAEPKVKPKKAEPKVKPKKAEPKLKPKKAEPKLKPCPAEVEVEELEPCLEFDMSDECWDMLDNPRPRNCFAKLRERAARLASIPETCLRSIQVEEELSRIIVAEEAGLDPKDRNSLLNPDPLPFKGCSGQTFRRQRPLLVSGAHRKPEGVRKVIPRSYYPIRVREHDTEVAPPFQEFTPRFDGRPLNFNPIYAPPAEDEDEDEESGSGSSGGESPPVGQRARGRDREPISYYSVAPPAVAFTPRF